MPKVPSGKHSGSASEEPSASVTSSSAGPSAHVLKRNQACHSCRRRKLKCDAKRPCSTCVRSLAHAKAHPQPGVVPPDEPDCTYDDAPAQPPEAPKNRFQKLENRIQELESLLLNDINPSLSGNGASPGADVTVSQAIDDALASVSIIPTQSSFPAPPVPSPPNFSGAANPSLPINGIQIVPTPTESPALGISTMDASPTGSYDGPRGMVLHSWPRALPPPDLLRHLVESFFSFHPHAHRLFHQPTFMTLLSYPPTYHKFPSLAVLHAICAVGSIYTAFIAPAEPPGHGRMSPNEIFHDRFKDDTYVEGFGETHIKCAKREYERHMSHGVRVLEAQQAMILVALWYWCHAKWVETYLTVGQIVRLCFPFGLYLSSEFKPLMEGIRATTLVPPPEDDLEDETRRNLMWISYTLERLSGSGHSWPFSLDDEDVSQLLPVHETSFLLGISFPDASERQHPFSKDVLLTHIPDQIDSFGLYVKACMLLSRVRTYNQRFRTKRFRQHESVAYAPCFGELWEGALTDSSDDPRRTSAFCELQRIADNFRASFPLHLQDPMASGTVDSHLFVACSIPHVAILYLHDPHAHIDSKACRSAAMILHASRGILQLLYDADTSSYDLSLLDYFCFFAWYAAARALMRFWQVAVRVNLLDQALTFKAEVEYIQSALQKAGRRVPLAQRYSTMIYDSIRQMEGESMSVKITGLTF